MPKMAQIRYNNFILGEAPWTATFPERRLSRYVFMIRSPMTHYVCSDYVSIRIRNHNHDCQPSHSEIKRNPTTIVEKLRLQLRKPSVQTPQAKGENACHIMEPTKQRLQSSSVCRFSVVFVVFPDSFPNFTRTYLLTYKALTMCLLFLRNCKHKNTALYWDHQLMH